MNRVLVTGCNGYIGSHVVKLLKEDGYHVEGWDINVYNENAWSPVSILAE